MRCKPGDRAVVIATDPDWRQAYLGRIVRVVRLHMIDPPVWETDPPFTEHGLTVWANDECLQPIRPDAEQETRELEKTA